MPLFTHSLCFSLSDFFFSSSADSAKMTQPMRGDQVHQPASARKSASLSSPSAARRLYRNLSGKFRVGTNPPALEDSVVSGRGGDKERLRKTTIVSQKQEKEVKLTKSGILSSRNGQGEYIRGGQSTQELYSSKISTTYLTCFYLIKSIKYLSKTLLE